MSKKKIKKTVRKLVNKDNIIGVFIYNLLIYYRKIRYFRYKYKFEVDNGMILFEASSGFNSRIKQLYEKMLYDEKYKGFQFIVALNNPKKEKYLIKDSSTVIIKKKSKAFLKFSSKSKYWFRNDKVDIYITPKREQVVCLISPLTDIDIYSEKIHRIYINKINKYVKKYISYNLEEIHGKISKTEKLQLREYLYKKHNIKEDKIKVQYKIYFNKFNEYYFNDFFSKEFFQLLYDRYHNKYQFLINTNCEFPDATLKKYKNFFVNVSNEEETILDYYSDILITNNDNFFEEGKFKRKTKLLYSNYRKLYSKYLERDIKLYAGTNTSEVYSFLDGYQEKINSNKFSLTENMFLKKFAEKIILTKLDYHHTLCYEILKNHTLIPLKNNMIKFFGFCRNHFFVLSENYKVLKTYENKYYGKRCFLIGNGPSLTFEDLDLIKNEITFGCNLIYKIYNKTTWRPTFHCLADGLYAKKVGSELVDNICSDTFTVKKAKKYFNDYEGGFKVISLDAITPPNNGKYKVVSPLAYHYPGGTVMSMMLCLAMYMGFTEIYLIGVDCTSSLSNSGHFVQGYMNGNIKRLDMKRIAKRLNKNIVTEEEVAEYYHNRVMYVYEKIEKYAKKRNIKIMNSTRGGALEIFERKHLEDIFNNKGEV